MRSVAQPYISKITLEHGAGAIGSVKVVITGYVDKEKTGSMVDTMQLSIVKLADRNIIKKIKSNNKKPIIELIENSRNNGRLGNISLSKAEVKVFDLGAKNTFVQEFFVDRNVSELSFYVICQINIDHPKYAEAASASRSYRKYLNRAAKFASEDVFRSGAPVDKANVFILKSPLADLPDDQKHYLTSQGENTNVWTGPAHQMPNGEWMSGTEHSPNMPYLTQKSLPNSTIHDYRVLDKISKINSNSTPENKSLNNKKSAQFSNLWVTNDKDGLVRLFFAIDMGQIIKNNFRSANEGFFSMIATSGKSGFDEIINLSKITNMVITRKKANQAGDLFLESRNHNVDHKTIARSEQRGGTVMESRYSVKEDTSSPNKNLDHTRKMISELKEIKGLHLANEGGATNNIKQIRYFGLTDVSMREVKAGLYRWGLELEIEDGVMKYIRQLSEDLQKGQQAMESYRKDFLNKGPLRADYMVNKRGPWVWALNILFKVIKPHVALNEREEQQMYILSSPATATSESITKVVDAYNNIAFFIQKMVKEFPSRSKRNIDEANSNIVVSGKKAVAQSISIEHIFSEVFDAKENGENGYDYLDVPPRGKESGAGLITFSGGRYEKRTTYENLRFFNKRAQQSGILSNNEMYASSLGTTQFSYLTPAQIRVQGSTFRTYGINKATLAVQNTSELGHFNTLMDLYSYNTVGHTHLKHDPTFAAARKPASSDCAENDIFSQKSNAISMQANIALIQNMATINTSALKKYESSCDEPSSKEELTIEKLMHNSTAAKYKEEIQVKDDQEDFINKTAGNMINPSFIFAPLFYMKNLDIGKEICCCNEALNLTTNKQILSTSEFKYLPNQLKALAASSLDSTVTNQTWYSDNQPLLKQLKNAAFYYLNQKNIVLVETLVGFKSGGVRSPVWVRLRKDHIENASHSPNKKLLCRIRPYTNSKICFNKNRILDLNLFNQCFLIDATGFLQTTSAPPKRTMKPIEISTLLDNNSLLKINSNFVRTNVALGALAKVYNTSGGSRRMTTNQTTAATATTTTIATTSGTGGMSSGGGRSY